MFVYRASVYLSLVENAFCCQRCRLRWHRQQLSASLADRRMYLVQGGMGGWYQCFNLVQCCSV